MNLIETATQLLSERLGLQIDPATLQSALTSLLGDGRGGLDLGALAGKMASSGELGSMLNSWLGEGENAAISAQGILDLLGEREVGEFAGQIGTDTETAAAGLSDVLPQLMDSASSGGSLLAAAGGVDGLLSAAKSFLR
jgi:uncharacterized protein YidB (DUF937 family)